MFVSSIFFFHCFIFLWWCGINNIRHKECKTQSGRCYESFCNFLIKDIIKREHSRINAFREEIKKYEGGKLYVENKRGKIFFAEYDGKSQHWITKDRNRIYQLARKEYIKRSIIISEKTCDILEESVVWCIFMRFWWLWNLKI